MFIEHTKIQHLNDMNEIPARSQKQKSSEV